MGKERRKKNIRVKSVGVGRRGVLDLEPIGLQRFHRLVLRVEHFFSLFFVPLEASGSKKTRKVVEPFFVREKG